LIVFADDTTLAADGPYPETIIRTLEADLIIITEWVRNNMLVLNAKKSQAICFNFNQKLGLKIQKSRSKLTISYENNKIAMFDQVKLLGVVKDNKLLFGPQTDALISKVNSKIALLKKSLYLFTDNFRPNLFKIFIQSIFDYCSSLTIHLSCQKLHNSLELCFAKSIYNIIKIKIKNKALNDQYESLDTFNILPLQMRRFFRLSTFIFTIVKNKNIFIF
jgi:hypothetical protein